MAMALRLPAIARAVTEMAAAPVGLRRLFCSNARKFSFYAPARPPEKPSTDLLVSGLSNRTSSEGLRTAFAQFGEVSAAKVVTDRVSGYSKGFGIVRYANLEDSAKGIAEMDGKFLDHWVIFAEYARPREQSQSMQGFKVIADTGEIDEDNYFIPGVEEERQYNLLFDAIYTTQDFGDVDEAEKRKRTADRVHYHQFENLLTSEQLRELAEELNLYKP